MFYKKLNTILLIIIGFVCFFSYTPKVFGESGMTNLNVPSQDLRRLGVEAYVHGFLGGRSDYITRHPLVMGGNDSFFLYEMVWLYGIAYPVTRNSWSGAIIKRVENSTGSEIRVYIDKPMLGSFSGEKRTFDEWMALGSASVSGVESITRTLRIDNVGILDMNSSSRELMKKNIVSDISNGLDDALSNIGNLKRNKGAVEHIKAIWFENSVSSTVKLPKELVVKWEKLMKQIK